VLLDATQQLRKDHPDMIAGEYREFLAVHNPARRESPGGHPIRVETVSSKQTYFTDEQRLYT
jgi:formamidopyrimidine-DNA glycosylase